jgi:hypothetical protein
VQLYTVHLRRAADPLFTPDRGAVFVVEGFSWRAFVLAGIWALIGGHWLLGVVLFSTEILLASALVAAELGDVPVLAALAAWHVLIGLSAADLVRASLRQRGYRETAVVIAENVIAAERRFFAKP